MMEAVLVTLITKGGLAAIVLGLVYLGMKWKSGGFHAAAQKDRDTGKAALISARTAGVAAMAKENIDLDRVERVLFFPDEEPAADRLPPTEPPRELPPP